MVVKIDVTHLMSVKCRKMKDINIVLLKLLLSYTCTCNAGRLNSEDSSVLKIVIKYVLHSLTKKKLGF